MASALPEQSDDVQKALIQLVHAHRSKYSFLFQLPFNPRAYCERRSFAYNLKMSRGIQVISSPRITYQFDLMALHVTRRLGISDSVSPSAFRFWRHTHSKRMSQLEMKYSFQFEVGIYLKLRKFVVDGVSTRHSVQLPQSVGLANGKQD